MRRTRPTIPTRWPCSTSRETPRSTCGKSGAYCITTSRSTSVPRRGQDSIVDEVIAVADAFSPSALRAAGLVPPVPWGDLAPFPWVSSIGAIGSSGGKSEYSITRCDVTRPLHDITWALGER